MRSWVDSPPKTVKRPSALAEALAAIATTTTDEQNPLASVRRAWALWARIGESVGRATRAKRPACHALPIRRRTRNLFRRQLLVGASLLEFSP